MRKEAAPRNLNDNCYPSFQSIWSSLAFWSPSWASSCFIFPPTPTKKWISVSPFYSDSWSSSFLSPKSCPPPRRSVSWWSLYRKFVRIQYFDINPFSILTFYPTFQPFIHLQSPYITQYLSLSSRWFPWSPNTSCSRSSWIFWRSWWRSLSSTGVIERPPRTKCPSGSSSSSLSISRDCCSWGDLTKRPCWVSAYVHARACTCAHARVCVCVCVCVCVRASSLIKSFTLIFFGPYCRKTDGDSEPIQIQVGQRSSSISRQEPGQIRDAGQIWKLLKHSRHHQER